ncbi:MAG TPA: hypothetical protein VLT45_13060 [Kofleriaceae bacterium]|nr:hypothetical protein [Kofleriaceae bacterium]
MGTLGKNIEDVREVIGQRVGDMRMQVEDRLGDLSRRAGSTDEGEITSMLERLTASLPSSTWLALAGVSLVGSIGLRAFRKDRFAGIISELVPTFLLIGVYNKLVKLHGSNG